MNAKAIKFGQNSDETLVDSDRIVCDGGEDGHRLHQHELLHLLRVAGRGGRGG